MAILALPQRSSHGAIAAGKHGSFPVQRLGRRCRGADRHGGGTAAAQQLSPRKRTASCRRAAARAPLLRSSEERRRHYRRVAANAAGAQGLVPARSGSSAAVRSSEAPRRHCRRAATTATEAQGFVPARRGPSAADGKQRGAAAALPPRSSHCRGRAGLRASAPRFEHRCREAARRGGGTADRAATTTAEAHGLVPAHRGLSTAAEEQRRAAVALPPRSSRRHRGRAIALYWRATPRLPLHRARAARAACTRSTRSTRR